MAHTASLLLIVLFTLVSMRAAGVTLLSIVFHVLSGTVNIDAEGTEDISKPGECRFVTYVRGASHHPRAFHGQ